MPNAARKGDNASGHDCMPPTTILSGSSDVFINGQPAARVGDSAGVHTCPCPKMPHGVHGREIDEGAPTVFINGLPAARMGDAIDCGGSVASGSGSVFIGNSSYQSPTQACEEQAARMHLPFIDLGSMGPPPVLRLPIPPTTMDEALNRLDRAGEHIQWCRDADRPLPTSPFSTRDKAEIVDKGLEERFILRIVLSDHANDDGFVGKPGEKITTYWTAPFSQVEHCDSDAEMMRKTLGLEYNEDARYTLLLIDQKAADDATDMRSFIPTYENTITFLQEERKKNFEENIDLIPECMTPEYSQEYERLKKMVKERGIDLNDEIDRENFPKALGMTPKEKKLFDTRMDVDDLTGANEHFLGNGLTRNTSLDEPVPLFGIIKPDQQYGAVEVFTHDKNPQTLGKLESLGLLKRIKMTSHRSKT